MNMIDRIAKHLDELTIVVYSGGTREQHLKIEARKILELIREPLPDIEYKFEMISPVYKEVWRAMIDAALKE